MRQVAVKLFKGDITSDGLPRSEMNACIAAGKHPCLIPVLGQVAHHPDGANGLVMSLIDARFRNLAGPPDLASCTRDVYASGVRFNMAAIARVTFGIASAVRHIHQRGVLHGDLYAHNILYDDQGSALLGDFGAASFYPPTIGPLATGLQQLEVRAFGCLLEELIERYDGFTGTVEELAALNRLKVRCLSEAPECRPLFEEIEQVLGDIVDSCANQCPTPAAADLVILTPPD